MVQVPGFRLRVRGVSPSGQNACTQHDSVADMDGGLGAFGFEKRQIS